MIMSNRRTKKRRRGIGVVEILVSSFLIGNIVSWSLGAYPRSFDEIPMDQETQETVQGYEEFLQESPNDVEILANYGALLSSYNKLDEAEEVLEKALQVDPNHALAGVWMGSNTIKQAGAAIDLTWGIPKLLNLSKGMDLMNQAVERDPDDAIVRVVRLSTMAFLKRGNFNELCGDEEKLNPDVVEDVLRTDASLALAAYFSSNPTCGTPPNNLEKAKKYLEVAGNDLNILQKDLARQIQEQITEFEAES